MSYDIDKLRKALPFCKKLDFFECDGKGETTIQVHAVSLIDDLKTIVECREMPDPDLLVSMVQCSFHQMRHPSALRMIVEIGKDKPHRSLHQDGRTPTLVPIDLDKLPGLPPPDQLIDEVVAAIGEPPVGHGVGDVPRETTPEQLYGLTDNQMQQAADVFAKLLKDDG